MLRVTIAFTFAVLGTTSPAFAAADGAPAACIAAHEHGQAARASRKLVDARASFVACAREGCPDVVRDHCVKALREVDAALPSIVLSATVDGKDATDVNVLLDGERVESGLDGRALVVDPGPHVARFERNGRGRADVSIVAREGEKNRLVVGTFVAPASATAPTVLREGATFPWVPVSLAGAGVLALGTAFVVHLDMTADAGNLQSSCAPRCAESDRDALSDQLAARNVSLGIGVGALALAAVTYFAGRGR